MNETPPTPSPKDGTAHGLTAAVSALLALVMAVALPFTSMDLARSLFEEGAEPWRPALRLVLEMAAFLGCVLLARYHWRRRR